MPGPVVIWAAIEGALTDPFAPGSAYGALMFTALYYAGRRRARARSIER